MHHQSTIPETTWFIRLAIWRLTAQWRSVLTVVVGVLLAAVIGASIPLYVAAIAQAGLKQHLDHYPASEVHIHSRSSLRGENTDDFAWTWSRFNQVADQQAEESFGGIPGWVSHTVHWAETALLVPVLDGDDIEGVRFRIAYYEGWTDTVELVSGTWPDDPEAAGNVIEIVLSVSVSGNLGIGVGDQIVLDQRGWDTSRLIEAQVTGLIRPVNPSSPYWMTPSPLRTDSGGQWQLETNLLTTKDSLSLVAGQYIPKTSTQVGWRWTFDHGNLRYSNIQSAIDAVTRFGPGLEASLRNSDGELPSFVFATELAGALESYRDEVEMLAVPFRLLLLQLGGLVLFFLMVMGALVRRAERREIALLQSRGALDSQIVLLRGVEAAMICISATLLAPVLARGFLAWMVPLFTNVETLPISLTTTAYLYAGAVATAAFTVLMITLLPVLKRPIVHAGGSQERSGGQSWWQRLNLDLILLVIGLAALWRIVGSRSLLVETSTGQRQADPLLLLTPTILIFAIGSVSLRLFPSATSLVARFFSGRKHLDWSLAAWQVSREPLHYGRIAFLLASAISVGWFAISFNLMLVNSRDHQAAYSAGADLRMAFQDTAANDPLDEGQVVSALAGIDQTSIATRITGVNMALGPTASRTTGELLAVDHDTFPVTADWRYGLDPLTMPPTSPELPDPGRTLPLAPERIRFWAFYETAVLGPISFSLDPSEALEVSPASLIQRLSFVAYLRDPSGRTIQVPMGAVNPDSYLPSSTSEGTYSDPPVATTSGQWPNGGWVLYEGRVPAGVEDPLSLDRLVVRTSESFFAGALQLPSLLTLRDLSLWDSEHGETPLDWLAESEWRFVNESEAFVTAEPAPVESADGQTGLQVGWMQDRNVSVFSLMLDYPEVITVQNSRSGDEVVPDDEVQAIPAVVSRTFSTLNALAFGQRFRLTVDESQVWFEVYDVVDFFPTLYPDDRPFVVVDQTLLAYTLRQRPLSEFVPNELWLRLAPGTTEEDVLSELGKARGVSDTTVIHTYDQALKALEEDLLLEGLLGLLAFSSLIGFMLSFVSLVTYVSVNVQTRRVEMAVLRALGFPFRRLIVSIALEAALVMVIAVAVGIVTGLALSTQVLPGLSLSTSGEQIIPPPVVQLDLITLLFYILGIAGLLIAELVLGSLLVRRLASLQAIRVTVE